MNNTIDSTLLDNIGVRQQFDETSGPNNSLEGQDAFLQLMIAQLENQDPLNPMENGEFLSQLAQFEQVGGIEKLNDSFTALASSLESSQALQASAMVGRSVLIDSNIGVLSDSGKMAITADLPSSTNNLSFTITAPNGEVMRSVDLGVQAAGRVAFNWDGMTDSGELAPPGNYTITATIAGPNGPERVATLVPARVESVTLNSGLGGVSLNLGGLGSVQLSDVKEIM